MSLVGSLEDLGLADILQIVSLSRKSGLLSLYSDRGDGRILLRDGMVQGAVVKGEPSDLRDLLLADGRVDEAAFEQARELAGTEALSLDEALARQCGVSCEELESLRRDHVERCVLRMFGWRSGEFRFEIRQELEADERELLLLPSGLNIQYLTMEATRLDDERSREPGPPGSGSPEPAGDAAGALVEASVDPEDDSGTPGSRAPADAYLIAIDADLSTLEWLKASVDGLFRRVHIFQRHENALDRIRQYLVRGQAPIVVVSRTASGDAERSFVRRLRALAPKLAILTLQPENAAGDDEAGTDGLLLRPASLSSDPDRWHLHQALADRLRAELESRL